MFLFSFAGASFHLQRDPSPLQHTLVPQILPPPPYQQAAIVLHGWIAAQESITALLVVVTAPHHLAATHRYQLTSHLLLECAHSSTGPASS